MGNTLTSLTSNLSKRHLGVQPWSCLEAIESKLDTGDIVIFSTRSFLGKAVRFHQQSFWSHCGMIVRLPFSPQVMVMECCVERESLFDCRHNGRLTIGSTLQTLRSKIYSGGYDLVAVRKMKWKSAAIRDEHFKTLKVLTSEQEQEFSILDPAYTGKTVELDPMVQRILEISQFRMEYAFNRQKFEQFLKPGFFETKYIYGANEEDLSLLASGEYLAQVLMMLNIFNDNELTRKALSKFKPKHFNSGSTFVLPFNKNLVVELQKETYLYLDYQVHAEDILLRQQPKLDFDFPKAQKEATFSYYYSPDRLRSYNFKTGDILLFQEEGPIAESLRKITRHNYTRAGMIVVFPGIRKYFLLDIQPLLFAFYELNSPKNKLIESRLISLESVLMSGYFSKVAFRRLEKQSGDRSISNNKHVNIPVYASMQMKETVKDLYFLRLRQLVEWQPQTYGPDVVLNFSSLFSGELLASVYNQMGLVDFSEDQMHKTMARHFSVADGSIENFGRGMRLSYEETAIMTNAQVRLHVSPDKQSIADMRESERSMSPASRSKSMNQRGFQMKVGVESPYYQDNTVSQNLLASSNLSQAARPQQSFIEVINSKVPASPVVISIASPFGATLSINSPAVNNDAYKQMQTPRDDTNNSCNNGGNGMVSPNYYDANQLPPAATPRAVTDDPTTSCASITPEPTPRNIDNVSRIEKDVQNMQFTQVSD